MKRSRDPQLKKSFASSAPAESCASSRTPVPGGVRGRVFVNGRRSGVAFSPPAAAAGSEAKLNLNDALAYLKVVKDMFLDQREKYDTFLGVMKDFKAQRVETARVASTVKELFKEHPTLILGFNRFLPKEHAITTTNDEEAPQKSCASLRTLVHGGVRGRVVVNGCRSGAAFSPPAAAAGSSPKLTIIDALAYMKDVKDMFQDQREKYDRFLDILKDFRFQRVGTADVAGSVKELFEGHPNLIRGFNTFLPEGDVITLADEDEVVLAWRETAKGDSYS